MALELKKAQRKKAKLKLGMSAPPGGGKTAGSLLIAYGLMKEKYPTLSDAEIWEKIAVVDSENGSGQLYVGAEIAGTKIGEYNTITLEAPYEADKYTNSVILCKNSGIEVVIIDSTTHLWSGTGGLLEQQGNIAKRTGNSYTAWRDITPQHNRFVETMLTTDIHIIATIRSKIDYVQEKDPNTGKTTVRKVGLNPIQKEGMEYEFTVFFEIDAEHNAFGSKDRTSIFDQKTFKITPEVGRKLMAWLESGQDENKQVLASMEDEHDVEELKEKTVKICSELGGKSNENLMALLKEYHPSGNPNKIESNEKRKELYNKLVEMKG